MRVIVSLYFFVYLQNEYKKNLLRRFLGPNYAFWLL